ncbi:type II secretion system protein N [Candidatus Poribacteria bacterium]
MLKNRMKVSPRYLIMLLITAFIVVMWSVAPYCLDALSGAESHVSPTESDKPSSQAASSNKSSPSYLKDFVYPVDNIRDPFVQVSASIVVAQTTSPGKKLGIVLTGIIWDDENPIAIVADSKSSSHLVRTGEEISNAKILAIHPRSIIIKSDGKTQELLLWPDSMWHNINSTNSSTASFKKN